MEPVRIFFIKIISFGGKKAIDIVPTLACSSSQVGSTTNFEPILVYDVTNVTLLASNLMASNSSSETLNSLCSTLRMIIFGILQIEEKEKSKKGMVHY